jgi:hypothetical protein
MQDRSFWEVANSSAVFDGFHDVAYAEAERALVARVQLGLGLCTEPAVEATMWFRLPNNVISLERYRQELQWRVA